MRPALYLLAICIMMSIATSASAGPSTVIVHVPGYAYSAFATTSLGSATDLDLDASGNVYFCKPGDIRRISPAGTESPWSQAQAADLVFASNGNGYGVGSSCGCILAITSTGAATTIHSDSAEWRWVALSASGSLYASSGGAVHRLYSVDPSTGTPTVLVDGGPGPSGSGLYSGLLTGADGNLYANGTSDGTPAGAGVFRLNGTQFIKVGPFPDGGFELAQDNQQLFYTVTTVFQQTGAIHEVWQLDPSNGSTVLLAEGPHAASCIAYDRQRNRLYVGDNLGTIYYISKGPTPTRRETWSGVKTKYH